MRYAPAASSRSAITVETFSRASSSGVLPYLSVMRAGSRRDPAAQSPAALRRRRLIRWPPATASSQPKLVWLTLMSVFSSLTHDFNVPHWQGNAPLRRQRVRRSIRIRRKDNAQQVKSLVRQLIRKGQNRSGPVYQYPPRQLKIPHRRNAFFRAGNNNGGSFLAVGYVNIHAFFRRL